MVSRLIPIKKAEQWQVILNGRYKYYTPVKQMRELYVCDNQHLWLYHNVYTFLAHRWDHQNDVRGEQDHDNTFLDTQYNSLLERNAYFEIICIINFIYLMSISPQNLHQFLFPFHCLLFTVYCSRLSAFPSLSYSDVW